MRRLLRAHVGVAIAAGTALLVIAAGTLGFIVTRPHGVALRPGPSPSTTVSAASPTPSETPQGSPTPSQAPQASPTARQTPRASPTVPTAAPTPACVNPATWPIARRLAQLMIVGGQFSNPAASTPAASSGVGAFVLFGQPAAGSGPAIQSGLAALSSAATAAGQVAPWMCTDEEGGQVQRLAYVIGPLPSPRQMAAQWSPAQVQATLAAHAAAMRSLGIAMDLAPVVDTASPTNPFADEKDRSFSDNGQVAAAYGLAFANGLRSAGVVPVAKHFPGIGHADADTDLGPATDPPLSQLEVRDLVPFEVAVAGGVPAIMVSHAAVPGLTGQVPASLSAATYQYLRDTVGFDGIAMTDSLGAGAVSAAGYSQPAAAAAALEAGADMVMVDGSSWYATLIALEQAVASGALPVSAVNASVREVLAAKGLRVCGS